MKRLIFILSATLGLTTMQAQEISLDSCQSWARQNHPLLKQSGVIDEISSLKQKSIESGNLPQIDLTGRATYQSDVTKLMTSNPNFNLRDLSKDQYKLYIDIKQKLYDGGISKSRKTMEEVDRKISQQQKEADLYKIRETVNLLFFQSLTLQENKNILKLKKQMLDERIAVVASAVKNGMELLNDLDNLKSEQLLTDQQLTEIEAGQQTSADLLSIITGKSISATSKYSMPVVADDNKKITRPELKLFSLQKEKLDSNKKLLDDSRKPYAFAFGQVGYGRPGLNMLNDGFDDWYMVGLGVSWNIWDGRKSKHDRAIIQKQKGLIDIQQENFERSINLSATQERNNVGKMTRLIESDRQIVALKEQIAKRSASALDNGTLTSADYIRDLNASLQSKISLEIHKIQKIQALINLNTILGN
ncbi:TolC family protein [Parabacteroides sp. FAFU027]|uniref:TolC family protein n=1 Tax=Parabacteroides sp. FAFU027 TaxID=2922715 RepID=UPI001FB04340|nr:TolC family protein [Parabacteroides sp. FAFU027]